MAWAYETFGGDVYDNLKKHEKEILDWADKQELNLSAKQSKALVNKATWQKQLDLLNAAAELMKEIGSEEYNDFNVFRDKVEQVLKAKEIKLSSSEKNAIFNAVSWYDANAEKVIKAKTKLIGTKLEQLLDHLGCRESELADYGYYPTDDKGKSGEGWYIEYETESDLRDTENVPLKENIYEYFLREVKPHVDEAWINLDATKIGYEISFNKYFYRHKPLRTIEEVSADILKLEEESEGLIREILNLA
jgi:type I restriction enzyme M protein